ncbi:hypothetical protein BKA67DRAFT_160728 [Truncatella angustata]|uniref:4-coumarate:coenzyme a ligase n=1 Tax=Truncatella angustata TaxID=152316 RepID=A0A9P8UQP5_9PEZI|nr:uncharacterized protein BKA67DRAFT_160728 [Truncatella angustata]KAH6656609.1 hypothetical protein BKA67DRAFT_160728 [Truncatella angustata]KAH8201538.1 hypothetical protein TruAng_004309 [Truncatella angustata]
MPIRFPKAGRTEGAAFAAAGIAGFAPLYMILPGAEERMAAQTLKWAPRWERNISYFAPPAQRVAQRVEPHASKNMKKLDDRLPLEKIAQSVHRRMEKGIDRFQK